MRTATRLANDYSGGDHPLGRSISIGEIPQLTASLRTRLGMSEVELDYSPASLKRLEDRLPEFSREFNPMENCSDEEILQIVREIGAYVGQVLVLHGKGEWESAESLWATYVTFKKKVQISKTTGIRQKPTVSLGLANIGAAALDRSCIGVKPILYKEYLDAKKKSFKEEL